MSQRSMSRRTFTLSAAVAPLIGPGVAMARAGGDWVRTETPGFVLYGDVGENTLRGFARDLEDFDGLLRTLHGALERSDGRPLPIYLVPRRSDLRRVKPDLDQAIGGFYSASIGDTFAVMSIEGGEDRGRGTLFHEYTHHFMSQHAPAAYPSWLIEGYAEYFKTVRFKPDAVELGVTNERIAWLRGRVWDPYDQILSRRALEGRDRDVDAFYAQSWILTHYMMSDPERLKRLTAYAGAVAAGGDPVGEMVTAAGMPLADLDRTLKRYMTKLPGLRMPRPTPIATPAAVVRLPPSADDLLLENQRLKMGVPPADRPAVLAMVRERAARYPDDRLADLTLARAENDFGDRPKAQAILKRRIEADPRDAEAIQMLGWSLMLQARADRSNAAALLNEARNWFGKGFAVDPNSPLLLYDYGISRRGEAGYPNDNAVNVLLKAQQLAPQVAAFRLAAADALMRRDRFDEAAALLEPVFNNPHGGPERQQARARFEQAVARRRPVGTGAEPAAEDDKAAPAN
jgi:tetratricopeptide (TPR) repeat protein